MFNISVKVLIINLIVSILGVVIALAGYHLYTDHKLVDAVRFDIMQRQQNANQQNQKPAN